MTLSLSRLAQGKALKHQALWWLLQIELAQLSARILPPLLDSPFLPLLSHRQASGLGGKIAAAQALCLIQSLALQDELKKRATPKMSCV